MTRPRMCLLTDLARRRGIRRLVRESAAVGDPIPRSRYEPVPIARGYDMSLVDLAATVEAMHEKSAEALALAQACGLPKT